MTNTAKVVSMNCQGLADPRKRRDVFHYLRDKSYSIYLLQDTHFDPKLENCIRAEWGYKFTLPRIIQIRGVSQYYLIIISNFL